MNSFKSKILLYFAILFSTITANALKIALVLDRGGKDDKSFNSSAYAGLLKAEKELGVTIKVVESGDDNAFENFMRSFAQKKFDLILAIGFSQAEALNKVAPQFPETKFAIVDGEVKLPNVKSMLFEEHEGSYLVGAIAALKSKTGSIGFIGGMDIPLIRRFEMGFKEGAQKINPKIQIKSGFIGVTSEAWNNPPKAKEIALSQYKGGVDIIFAAAGASNSGVFDAAEDKKSFAIGVDSNQNWVKPGLILTSMLKRVDNAVFDAIKELKDGKFTSGVFRNGLKSEGVGYALDEHNKALLTAADVHKIEELKKQILSSKIVVSDYYKIKK